MRRVCTILLVLVLPATVRASQPPIPGPAPDQVSGEAARDGLNLVHQLERLAGGKPIPVAAAPEADALCSPRPMPQIAGKPLLEALGLIGDAFSTPRQTDVPEIFQADIERRRDVFQPYAFKTSAGTVWTVARDRRMEEQGPPAPSDTLEDMPDFELSKILLHSLTAAQLETATKRGLRWSDYTDRQKRIFRVLFARPYAIYKSAPAPEGGSKRSYQTASEDPIPVEQCTLRLYIGFEEFVAPTGKISTDLPMPQIPGMPPPPDLPAPGPPKPQDEWYSLYPDDDQIRFVRRDVPWFQPAVPVYDPKMKPSDLSLDAKALAIPIGISGVTTLQQTVDAAAAASKLPLAVDKRLGCIEAFVGDAKMTCADALRLLTYSFDGAWRRVGPTYLLTWDRVGSLSAILESTTKEADMVKQVRGWRAAEKEAETPDWEALAQKLLGPPPGFPLGPTPAQWKSLSTPMPDVPDQEGTNSSAAMDDAFRFEFDKLDPAQQDLLTTALANRNTRPTSDPPNAPFSPATLRKIRLNPPSLMAYLDIPGVGAINISRATLAIIALDSESLATSAGVRQQFDKAEDERKKAAAAPIKLNYTTKAIAPPPLSAAEWPRLLAQMKRKGLDTVYVPVLWNGQTIFPSDHFPPLAVCKGDNLLAKVLALAGARGIHVIAAIHELAWRLPSSDIHWLSGHAELVDVDADGRGRRDWGLQNPQTDDTLEEGSSAGLARLLDPEMASDFVRPDAPEVRARLLGLVRELKAYKGLTGVALARWTRLGPSGYGMSSSDSVMSGEAPELGYTLAERIAFLREQGVDPVDLPSSAEGYEREDCHHVDFQDLWNKRRVKQDINLAASLIAELDTVWPGRVQLISQFGSSSDVPLPQTAVIVSDEGQAPKGRVPYLRIAPPTVALPTLRWGSDGPEIAREEETPAEARQKRLDMFHAQLSGVPLARLADPTSEDPTGLPAAKGIVLDFTGSPDLLWDGLAMLPNK